MVNPKFTKEGAKMTIHEKLLAIQTQVDSLVRDGKNLSDKYDFASDENVLDRFRPLMDEHQLLLIPRVTAATLHEGMTKSGTARYLTELTLEMVWYDVENKEQLAVPWYAQGVDLAGEKGVGKALTYAEKYFLLKFFHVATKKDDPDNDPRTGSGEKRQRGTQAAKELEAYHRAAITQMLAELYNKDTKKIEAGLVAITKNDKRGYAGVDSVADIPVLSLPIIYAKVKETYEARMQHAFQLKEPDHATD